MPPSPEVLAGDGGGRAVAGAAGGGAGGGERGAGTCRVGWGARAPAWASSVVAPVSTGPSPRGQEERPCRPPARR